MLEIHRDINSVVSDSAQAAAAGARMFEESATPSASGVQRSTDAAKPESSSSQLTFDTNSLYRSLQNKPKDAPGDGMELNIKELAAKGGSGKELKGKELKTDKFDGPAVPKELKDAVGQAKEDALKSKERSPNDEAIAIKQKLNALKEMEAQLKEKLAGLKDQQGTMSDQNAADKIKDGKLKKDPIDQPAVPKETQPLKPQGVSDAGQAAPDRIPPAVEDEATDAAQGAAEAANEAAQEARQNNADSESEYVQGNRLALELDENGDLTGMDALGTQITQRADGTTVIESEDGALKVTPDGHVTLRNGNGEEHYDLKPLTEQEFKDGTVDYRLPDGTLITRKAANDGNFSGFAIARPGQLALETFTNDHRVLYGQALRK